MLSGKALVPHELKFVIKLYQNLKKSSRDDGPLRDPGWDIQWCTHTD